MVYEWDCEIVVKIRVIECVGIIKRKKYFFVDLWLFNKRNLRFLKQFASSWDIWKIGSDFIVEKNFIEVWEKR